MKDRPLMLYERRKKSPVSIALSVLFYVFFIAIIVLMVLNIYLSARYSLLIVDGTSMQQTLQNQDCLYTDTQAKPKRGEIIIVDVTEYPEYNANPKKQKLIVKRLIAVGGDKVKCENGVVSLDTGDGFRVLKESYVYNVVHTDNYYYTVPEGGIFFLGDNRGVSKDSRAVGCLLQEDVVGVVHEWAVTVKWYSTGMERFRNFFIGENKTDEKDTESL